MSSIPKGVKSSVILVDAYQVEPAACSYASSPRFKSDWPGANNRSPVRLLIRYGGMMQLPGHLNRYVLAR